jgi:hypothetical protein
MRWDILACVVAAAINAGYAAGDMNVGAAVLAGLSAICFSR